MAISRYHVDYYTADRWLLPGDSYGPNGPRNDRRRQKGADKSPLLLYHHIYSAKVILPVAASMLSMVASVSRR